MVSPTKFRLVLGVAGQHSEVLFPMSKLALVTILAKSILLEGSAKFCLVAACAALGRLFAILERLCFDIASSHDHFNRGFLDCYALATSRVGSRTTGIVHLCF